MLPCLQVVKLFLLSLSALRLWGVYKTLVHSTKQIIYIELNNNLLAYQFHIKFYEMRCELCFMFPVSQTWKMGEFKNRINNCQLLASRGKNLLAYQLHIDCYEMRCEIHFRPFFFFKMRVIMYYVNQSLLRTFLSFCQFALQERLA